MECDQLADVDIAEAVAIGKAEGIVVTDVISHPLESAARHRLFTRVDERHLPRLGLPLMDCHRVEGNVKCDV